jgi:uncharacterized repeat protein (TIGR01451 family)
MSATQTRFLAIAAAVLFGAAQAGATGTDAGTDISNQASVDYTVGGVNQPDVNSNTVTFKTDRRILLTVAEVGGAYTDVAPGSTAQVLTFTVTNNTNEAADFRLVATQDGSGTTDAFGGTDAFDATNVQVFVDNPSAGTPGVFDAADTATFLDEVPEDATRTVFVVSDIPLSLANNSTAGVTLTAIAAQPGTATVLGSDWTATAGADTANAIDTVFGDVAGDTDANRDGRHSDDDAYRIRTATLTVTKTSTVTSDPFNGATNPKRIPGATVEYCVTVSNAGSVPATSVVLTDVLAGQPVTFVNGSLFTVDSGATCTGGDAEDDGATGADETDPNGASESGGTVSATFSSVPAGAGKALRFSVTIN